jgi:SET domain-containing protein
LGLFATQQFWAGDCICPGRLDGHRTPAGRYINHSADPNANSVKIDDDIFAYALRNIQAGEEILICYRTSVKVNFGVDLCPVG